MNKTLVDSMNEAAEDDIIFCLGDWSFGGINSIWEFRKDIKCKNIHLILGNHDHHIENNRNNLRSIFSSVNHYLEVKIDKHTFVLSHYPFASWNGLNKGWIHLHGHIHSDKIGPGKTLDVGFDGNNMKMWHINDILELLNNIPIASLIPNDHHEHER
jgi:calcineurin-like phosphoesterase family protein